jgi:uncharacterized protein (DUF2141 family)
MAAALGIIAAPTFAGELRIAFEGVRSPKGTILVGLYDSKESFDRAIDLSDKQGFLNDPQRVAGAALRVNGDHEGGIVFENIPPGNYAVILLHDEDGNGRLNKNFLGIPTESYGFSNGAHGFLSPPKFKDAAFTLDGSNKTITIALTRDDPGDVGSGSEGKPVNPASAGGQ